jgi:hypothetical protein
MLAARTRDINAKHEQLPPYSKCITEKWLKEYGYWSKKGVDYPTAMGNKN